MVRRERRGLSVLPAVAVDLRDVDDRPLDGSGVRRLGGLVVRPLHDSGVRRLVVAVDLRDVDDRPLDDLGVRRLGGLVAQRLHQHADLGAGGRRDGPVAHRQFSVDQRPEDGQTCWRPFVPDAGSVRLRTAALGGGRCYLARRGDDPLA